MKDYRKPFFFVFFIFFLLLNSSISFSHTTSLASTETNSVERYIYLDNITWKKEIRSITFNSTISTDMYDAWGLCQHPGEPDGLHAPVPAHPTA